MIEMINKLVQIVVMSAYVIMVLIKKLSYIHYMGGGGQRLSKGASLLLRVKTLTRRGVIY